MDMVKEVALKMSGILTEEQMQKLTDVMSDCARYYSITPNTELSCPEQTDWQKNLKLFLAAKSLKNCSENTLYNYNLCIGKMLQSIQKNVCDITVNDVRFYLATYRKERKISESYLNTMLRYINSFFEFCRIEGIIHTNPAERIEKVKEPKKIKTLFTKKDRLILRDNADCIRDIALMETLYSTAARVGEICSLNWSDVDFLSGTAKIYGQKGKAERMVYLSEECLYYLEKYLRTRKDDNDALFVSRRKPYGRIGKAAVQKMLREKGKILCMHAHPHKFRRTMLSNGAHKGWSLPELQKYAGHVKIETTMLYVEIANEDVRSTFNRSFN